MTLEQALVVFIFLVVIGVILISFYLGFLIFIESRNSSYAIETYTGGVAIIRARTLKKAVTKFRKTHNAVIKTIWFDSKEIPFDEWNL